MAIFLILALNLLVFTAVAGARIVFSLYALNLGASAASVGTVMGAVYLFPLLLSWPIGVLSDRFAPGGLLIAGIAAGACGMAVPYFFPVLSSLYVAAALLGLAVAFVAVMGQSLVGALSGPGERTRNFSNYSMTGSVSLFMGPLIAGLVIDHLGHRIACAGIAILLLLGIAALLAWGTALPRKEPALGSGGNLLQTLGDRRLWGMLCISSMSQLGNDVFQIFLPVYAHSVGLSATATGMMLSMLAASSFGVRLSFVRLIAQLGESRLLALAFYLGAITFALVPLASGAVSLGFLAFAFGLCQGCTQPLTMMMMFNSAKDGRVGEAIGLGMTTNNLARMLGPALFGGVASLLGLLAVFWINGLMMAAGGRVSARAGKNS